MEKRIGSIIILVEDRKSIPGLNSLFTEYCDIILGRQGVPLQDRGISLISLVVEGTTGQIGRFKQVKVKSVLTSYSHTDPSTE